MVSSRTGAVAAAAESDAATHSATRALCQRKPASGWQRTSNPSNYSLLLPSGLRAAFAVSFRRPDYYSEESMKTKSLACWIALVCALPLWARAQDKAKETVDATCNTCHPLSARVGSGYDAKGWHTVVRMMVNQGAPLPKDQTEGVTQYLIKTYPVDAAKRAKAAVIDGPVKVSMKHWDAATPGSRPHDPLAARDGSLW